VLDAQSRHGQAIAGEQSDFLGDVGTGLLKVICRIVVCCSALQHTTYNTVSKVAALASNTEEAFHDSLTQETVGTLYGAHYPTGRPAKGLQIGRSHVGLAADNLPDQGFAQRILKHEVLGHFGLNTVTARAATRRIRCMAVVSVEARMANKIPEWLGGEEAQRLMREAVERAAAENRRLGLPEAVKVRGVWLAKFPDGHLETITGDLNKPGEWRGTIDQPEFPPSGDA
jgi:hypothetical protein